MDEAHDREARMADTDRPVGRRTTISFAFGALAALFALSLLAGCGSADGETSEVDRARTPEGVIAFSRAEPRTVMSPADVEIASDADLFARSLPDGRTVRLTSGPGVDGGPVWSPEGMRLLFSRTTIRSDLPPVSRLWMVNAAGKYAQPATDCQPPVCLQEGGQAFSPDRRQMGFLRSIARGGGEEQQMIMRDLVENVERIVPFPKGFLPASGPTWTGGGSSIYLSGYFPGKKIRIWKYDFKSRELTRVNLCAGSPCRPLIAAEWTTQEGLWAVIDEQGLSVGEANGSPTELLVGCEGDPPDCPFSPAWSPDGSWLSYSMGFLADKGHLFVTPSDGGGEPVQLTSSPKIDSGSAWRPEP